MMMLKMVFMMIFMMMIMIIIIHLNDENEWRVKPFIISDPRLSKEGARANVSPLTVHCNDDDDHHHLEDNFDDNDDDFDDDYDDGDVDDHFDDDDHLFVSLFCT